jgi:hypothetical protein
MSTDQGAIGRRSFLTRGAATAGLGLSADLEAYPQNVNRNSKPSDLRITDMRIALVRGPNPDSAGDSRRGTGIRRHDPCPNRYQSGNFGLRPGDRGRPPA